MVKKRTLERAIAGLVVIAMALAMLPLSGMPALAASPGDIVINEIMQNPAAVLDDAGEWFELYNPTGSDIDINGWTIKDNDIDSHVIANGGPLIVAAGGFLVLGNNDDSATNGGASVDYSYGSSWFLSNGADEVVLVDAGDVEIDRVEYDGGPLFPDPTGASMALQDPTLDNNDGANWCTASTPYGSGDLGTPGAENDCGAPPPPVVSIYEIQSTTDPYGDSPYDGEVVTTEGVVTAAFYGGYFIEDPAGGAWSGLFVYDFSGPELGQRLRLTGLVDEYYNLTELKSLTGYEVLSTGNSLPDPEVLPTGDVSQEQWEGVLVRVEGVTVVDPDLDNGEWSVSDGSGDVVIDDKGSYTYVPGAGDELEVIIGPVDYTYDAFKIQPRDDDDIALALDYVPIYDIQYTADSSGDSPYLGQVDVTTEGVVTAVFYGGYFIEDPAGGAWNGLYVYDSNVPALGDRLRLTGLVDEYYNLTELKSLTGYEVLSSGNPLPDPEVLPTGDVSQEQWEGVLVRVEGVTVVDPDLGNGEWSASDGSGDVVIDDKGSYTYVPGAGDVLVAIIGPVDFTWDAFKIQPRDDDDIIATLPPPPLVINEILADPAYELAGDANGDGVRDSSQDEFVEIVNNSDADMDISGWTLADSVSVRHVFPSGTVVPAQCAIVVFGGGTPTGTFGGAVVQTASGGYLGLNNGGDTITLSDGSSDQAVVAYGGEGGNDQSLTRDPDITGSFVQHSTATGSDGALFSPGTQIDGSSFAGCSMPEACGDDYTHVYDIQGDGLTSPLDGSLVSVEGVVTGDFQTSEGLRGFYLQDPAGDGDPDTSDGIFVYDGSYPEVDVSVGDAVRVRGTVDEYYEVTEITSISLVIKCGTGSVAATPVELPVEVDLEPYEGMLVTFPEVLTASQNYFQGRYGQVTMSSEGRMFQPTNIYRPLTDEAIELAAENWRRMFILDDGTTSQNPDPIPYIGAEDTLRAGDTVVGLTGVVDYGPINSSSPPVRYYRLQPTEPVEFTRVNERTAGPDDVGGVVKIASFNVLNYFTTIDTGDWICGPSEDMECRGADSTEEFDRQRAKIIAALSAMDADVVGLIEIENYPGDVPTADLVSGLNDMLGVGTYDYIATGAIGTDAIRQAFIYKPATVTPVGAAAVLDSSVDPDFNSDYNRPAIAQTFDRSTGGGRFTAVVNHLKSKGSDCNDLSDPDTGDGQGNCNLTREAAAIALTEWLATDPTGSGDPDFFIVGDLNSYAMEDPIIAIEEAGYTNLIKEFSGTWAYSYIFDGLSGYLDHGLATAEAAWQVMGATIWHINTDEPSVIDYNTEYKPQDLYTPTPYRASDHDPVIVGFCESVPPEVTITLNRDTLWPPRHQYVTVHAKVDATDNLDTAPLVELVSVTSSQPDDGLGDGDTADDIVILNDFTFKLRAERMGGDEDRIYTIIYTVTDDCGNVTLATATVTVPHDMGR